MRIAPFQSALSGFQAGARRIANSAHNVANLMTENVRPLRSIGVAREDGGNDVATQRAAEPRPVDLARERVDQILALTQAKASLRVLEAESEMRGQLVDIDA